MSNEKYSSYLNEVRKNLVAPGKQLLLSPKSAYFWCSTTGTPDRYIPVGDLDRSPLMRSYGYASAGDRPTLVCQNSPEPRSLHALCGLMQPFPKIDN